jgi:hypothetical protein
VPCITNYANDAEIQQRRRRLATHSSTDRIPAGPILIRHRTVNHNRALLCVEEAALQQRKPHDREVLRADRVEIDQSRIGSRVRHIHV